ncbi:Alpha-galactosidase [Tsuneonella dongtanensis]|uniref:alpha-galactosidase n=1 Tax=Tsuneonella dongtanensis TaxID=692370 RepID=A0A1B2AC66_9SPHN|nr:alpha-galactosidase [Tsuneonella dongtanensis]ANY19645.1 Alpha-galactosidase [Tsuneonella dongtanensis]
MTADLLALHTDEASLVLERDPERGLLWRHLGARVDAGELPPLAQTRGRATFSLDRDVSLAKVPPAGLGWFGPPMLEVRDPSGEALIFAPSTFDVSRDARRIVARAQDPVAGLDHELEIEIVAGGCFRFTASITNHGAAPVALERIASLQVPLPASAREIVSWRGRHNAELVECSEAMPQHRWERLSRRGISGHGGPPGVYVLDGDCSWHSGLAFALQLAWSGDSAIAIERDDEGYWTLGAEAVLAPGEIVIGVGETHRSPPAFLAISPRGRNGAMQQQHSAVRAMVQWPDGAMRPRPVHLNSWEACYFNHDAARIRRLTKAGADIGIERFVLDDGWFKGRRNDTSGLGDWEPDPAIYPDGLAPLAREVETMGMEFGLWVEPEMISPDSDLYRAHSDWALASPRRPQPTARNQLVVDMRRAEARDHLFERLDCILSQAPVSYLKWDHNRDHAPGGGAGQTLGTYDLLERLRKAHPAVEIEGCAGGGGRSDAGLAPYVHRYWTSDNIDAVARVSIQRGFQAFLPPEMMGSHVGASPAHVTGRSQSMAFRAAVACMGHFGVELDPDTLEDKDRAELARWIAFYKAWRHILHGNRTDLGEGPDSLRWQAQGTDVHKLLFCIRTDPAQDRRPQPLKLPFAASTSRWRVRLLEVAEPRGHVFPMAELFTRMQREPVEFTGSWLASAGLPIPTQRAESVAIFQLEAAG